MATFVAASSGTANASTLTVSAPAGIAANDLLLISLATNDLSVDPVPSGFTLASSGSSASGLYRAYYKVATGSETSWTLTWTGTFKVAVSVAAYRGVSTTTPLAVTGTAAARPNGTTITATSVTTTAANQTVVDLFAEKSTTNTLWTEPSGTTVRNAAYVTGSGATSTLIADYVQATAGATGTKIATCNSTSPQGFGVQLALTDTAAPTRSGKAKVWDGSAWVSRPVKTWDGSAWVVHPVKAYDGSTFVVSK